MWPFGRKPKPEESLSAMLAKLAECGICLAPGITEDDVAERHEEAPLTYPFLLCTLGTKTEDDTEAPLTDSLWYFDAECIYDDGDYAAIARDLAHLSRGAVTLEDVRDHVGEDGAWLEVTVDGKRHRWDFELNGDWMDPALLERMGELIEARGNRRFTEMQSMGQDGLVACVTEDEKARLNELPGVTFR
jgi:hypothetical protein